MKVLEFYNGQKHFEINSATKIRVPDGTRNSFRVDVKRKRWKKNHVNEHNLVKKLNRPDAARPFKAERLAWDEGAAQSSSQRGAWTPDFPK